MASIPRSGMGLMSNYVVDGRSTLKKAQEVVLARETGDLELADRKLFNYLTYRVYKSIRDADVHRIPVGEVLDYLGHRSTASLNDSLKRLSTASIQIEYIDDNGSKRTSGVHYLSFDLSHTADGFLYFAFDPLVRSCLYEPRVYAILSLARIKRFRSDYGARLYEMMSMYASRRDPCWKVSIEEFRDRLNVRGAGYERFDNLKRRIVDRAIEECNEVAEFDVSVEFQRGGRGGKVVGLKFTAMDKSHSSLMQARDLLYDAKGRGGPRTARDPHTIDLIDGRSDEERGDIPALKAETVQEAKDLIADYPSLSEKGVDALLLEFMEKHRNRRVRDADSTFLRWLFVLIEREKDAQIREIDDDTIGDLLAKWETT
jgi:hypothetical protein